MSAPDIWDVDSHAKCYGTDHQSENKKHNQIESCPVQLFVCKLRIACSCQQLIKAMDC